MATPIRRVRPPGRHRRCFRSCSLRVSERPASRGASVRNDPSLTASRPARRHAPAVSRGMRPDCRFAWRLSGKRVTSGRLGSLLGMGARFIGGDREQVFLMPPSVRDWVPEGHLVWTVIEAVAELDLSAMYADYRADGHGRPAYEPSMMVALLLYAYARGNRSSRGVERACVDDVAYRVITGNVAPDHSTIADFRCRHERALGEVFSGVLGLCARAGLVSVGVVAIDGAKIAANA